MLGLVDMASNTAKSFSADFPIMYIEYHLVFRSRLDTLSKFFLSIPIEACWGFEKSCREGQTRTFMISFVILAPGGENDSSNSLIGFLTIRQTHHNCRIRTQMRTYRLYCRLGFRCNISINSNQVSFYSE